MLPGHHVDKLMVFHRRLYTARFKCFQMLTHAIEEFRVPFRCNLSILSMADCTKFHQCLAAAEEGRRAVLQYVPIRLAYVDAP